MDADSLFSQAIAAIKAKQPAEARRLLTEVVRTQPRHEQAWLALASVLTERTQAIQCLRRVLALNPNNETAKQWLALAERAATERLESGRAPVDQGTLEPQAGDGTAPAVPDIPLDEPGDEERPVPRLGKYLLDFEFITASQLKAALLAQRQSAEQGESKRLGDVLLEQGAISEERLNFAIREQHRNFYSLFND